MVKTTGNAASGRTNLITKFMDLKRKSTGSRVSSPTGETSSPPQKNAKASPTKEIDHTLPPKQITPQRDKLPIESMGGEKKQRRDKKTRSPQSALVVETQPEVPDGTAKSATRTKQEETQRMEVEQDLNSNRTDTTDADGTTDMETELSNTKDYPPLPTVATKEKNPAPATKTQSTLKESFIDKAKAAKDKPAPLLPQWKAHRLACMFSIEQPENNNARISMITTELNKMLAAVKKYTPKAFVRKFAEHGTPRDRERKHWISMLDRSKASDLIHYTHGFLAWVTPRSGTQRLLIQLIVPVQTDIPDLLLDMNNSQWASKNERRLYDIKEQDLYAPRQIGWLFRSNHVMAASDELQKEFERKGKIKFGLTFKTVSVPGQKYNKDTAVKAVCVSTNAGNVDEAWALLTQWYNSAKPVYPLGIPLVFVPGYNHPHVHNNPHAAKNISTLLERQKIFINDTATAPCPILACPDEPTEATAKRTIRQLLMEVTATTMGNDLLGAKLFHAISKKTSMSGSTEYHFTFHKAVAREAKSVVSGLAQFIKKELRIDPDPYCFAHMYDTTQKWDNKTRCLSNETINFLDKIAGIDLNEEEEPDIQEGSEIFTMDAKQKRESRRIMGLKDDETVQDITKKKKKPRVEGDDISQFTEISGLTQYTSNTAASHERKQLRKKVDEKQAVLDEQEAEIARLKAALAGKIPAQTPPQAHLSGEDTAESPPQQDGWEPDPDYNTPPATVDVHQEKSQTVVDLVGLDKDSDEEVDNHSCEEDYYDEDDRQIPYFGQGVNADDGLKFLYRGSVLEIIEVKKHYADSKYPMFETNPFQFKNDPDETWVELFQVVDGKKFRSWYDMEETQERDTCVRFSDNVTVTEVDGTGRLGKETEVPVIKDEESTGSDIDYHKSSVTEEGNEDNSDVEESPYAEASDVEEHSDLEMHSDREPDSDVSIRSTDSEESNPIDEMLGLQEELKPSVRVSTITADILKEASNAITNSDTDGGGPNQHE